MDQTFGGQEVALGSQGQLIGKSASAQEGLNGHQVSVLLLLLKLLLICSASIT